MWVVIYIKNITSVSLAHSTKYQYGNAEVGGKVIIHGLPAMLSAVWHTGAVFLDWKRSPVVQIWKGKGSRQYCDNYRDILFLSVLGRVLPNMLVMQIRSYLINFQKLEQSGLKHGKWAHSSTSYPCETPTWVSIGTIRRLCRSQEGIGSANLETLVHYGGLWDSCKNYDLMSAIYSESERGVKCGRSVPGFFPVKSDVRQVLVPALSIFNTCIEWLLSKTADQSHSGACVGDIKATYIFRWWCCNYLEIAGCP